MGLVGCWSVRLVWTPLFLLTHGQVGTSQVQQKIAIKKQQTEGGREKRQNTDLRKAKRKKSNSVTCVLCVAIARTQRKSSTSTKDADSSLAIVFTARRPVSDWPSSLLTPYCLLNPWDPSLPASQDGLRLTSREENEHELVSYFASKPVQFYRHRIYHSN